MAKRTPTSIESIVTAIFMLLAVAAVVVYFVLPSNRVLFYTLGGVAIVIRIGQYLYRLFARVRFKREKRNRLLADLPPVSRDMTKRKEESDPSLS